MKPPEQDQLLKDVLGGEEPSDLRAASLEQALGMLRRRRRHRLVTATALLALTFATAGGLLLKRVQPAPDRPVASNLSRPQAATPQAANLPPIKFISDDELLALFPNRSVGLIGSHGHQTLEFFDEADAQE